MMDMFESLVAIYKDYSGSSVYMLLALIAIIYLWLTEQEKTPVKIVCYIIATVYALFFIPFYAHVLIRFVIEDETYYRMLWLIPTGALCAYATVKIIIGLKELWRRLAVGVLFVCMLAGSGSCFFVDGTYTRAENAYHIPQVVVELVDLIKHDEIGVISSWPPELVTYVRQYDSSIKLTYGRDLLVERWNNESEIYDAMSADVLDADAIRDATWRGSGFCIIIDTTKPMIGTLEGEYFLKFGSVGQYDVYMDRWMATAYYGYTE